MNIRRDFIPVGKTIPMEAVINGVLIRTTITRRPGLKTKSERPLIVVHTNANKNSTLDNERGWLINKINTKAASWNIMIRENEALEVIPFGEVAYHAGNYTTNLNSYGVELHEGGDFDKTLSNAVDFIADKLKNVYGISSTEVEKYVSPHRAHTKTSCPRLIRSGAEWDDFIRRIKSKMKGEVAKVTIKFSKALRIGDKGSEVRLLQSVLNLDGFNLIVDGDFGRLTRDAVLSFQRRYKLVPDGFVGAITQKSLERVANRPYRISYFDHQTQYVVIPKNRVAAIKTIKAEGSGTFPRQTTLAMEKSAKPDIIVNGGLFDMKTGAPCHYFVHEGKQINYNAYAHFGMMIDYSGKVSFGNTLGAKGVYYGTSFAPTLFVQGKKLIDSRGLTGGFLSARNPKHAFMETENFYVEIAVDGRNPLVGYKGRNSYEMATLCAQIANKIGEPIKHAGEHDGGASISIRCDGREITRSYKAPRPVPMGIGYYFIK